MIELLTKNTACLIERMTAHAAADEIIQGKGWEGGKGCFVGCCLHTYDHAKFPSQLGWPEPLAHLCDAIFEALKNGQAKQFAVDVPAAVGVDGKDLSMVVPQWIYWTLTDDVKPTAYPQFQPFIDAVVELYEEWTRTGVRPTYRAGRAYRTDRAYRAYLADLAGRAGRAEKSAAKLIELLKAAPVKEAIHA